MSVNLKLGPEGFTGIAIVGSAPSSLMLAPYKDDKWAIWCVSPAVYPQAPRSDVWFELHRFFPAFPGGGAAPNTRPWFSPEFTAFLNQYKGPVFMSAEMPHIPNSVRYPFEQAISRYGPYHFCSSVSWMLAMAIDTILEKREKCELKPREGSIGMWGIDMSASEEYAYQRPSCQHFLGMAMGLGINVVLPPESDLMRPPLMYGIGEQSQRHIKLTMRLAELEQLERNANAVIANAQIELAKTIGAKGAIEYVMQSWCDDVTPDLTKATSLASEYVKPVVKDVPRETLECYPLVTATPSPMKGNGKDYSVGIP